MRLYYSVALFFSLVMIAFSATATLKGVVKDESTNKPLANAVVRLIEKGLTDTTDVSGNFLFSSFPVSILPKGFSAKSFAQPRYISGKGIVFINKRDGIVKVDILDLSGKTVAALNNSILNQGVWSAPLGGLAKGTYLCRIQYADETNAFRFMMSETGKRQGPLTKIGDIGGVSGSSLSKTAASAIGVDSIVVSKPGYYSETVLWIEKITDSLTIFLQDTGSTLPVASIRTIIPFDAGWLFNKGDVTGADKLAFAADATWRSVSVPHDWSIEGPFAATNPTTGYGAWAPSGIGWYRKHFTLPASLQGRRIFIEFDGVMTNSTVYINGTSLGNRPYGYVSFRYEITSQATFGATENVISVKTDDSLQPCARYYTGAGINRHVRIIAVNPVHIDKWVTYVTTPTVTTASAAVHVQTTVVNQGASSQSVTVQAVVIDPSGTKLAPVTSAAQSVAAAGSADFAVDVTVSNPKLWDITSPNMYQVQTTVQSGTTGLDDEVTPFGIRTIKYDPDQGFSLNGKVIKQKGACLHHDVSGLGAAVPQRAIQRRLAILKSLGVNAIRTAHNPEDPEMLDVCDRMGFLVMDEFFDVWTAHKYSQVGDYATYFNQTDPVSKNKWYQTDVNDIVMRHRNHPSIVLYSIGNEIRDGLSTRLPLTKDMVGICHKLDPTRAVTQALFRPSDNGDYSATSPSSGTLPILDVFGANYRTNELLEAIKLTPHHAGVATEMGPNITDWASFFVANPQVVGEYIWTGASYLGETGAFPSIGGNGGFIDRVGTINSIGYTYAGLWNTSTPAKPKTSTGAAAKVVLTVDHATITTDLNDVAYVKATIADASGVQISTASNPVKFTLTGSAGEIIALDSGIPTYESFRGDTRNAYQGICFAIVRMNSAGSITVTASSTGLTGSSVTVTGAGGTFVPCTGNCD
jgi:beta-galactosidase